MTQQHKKTAINHSLDPNLYQPIISGGALELIDRCDTQKYSHPLAVEVFLGILQKHRVRHPLLEDWLLIRVYELFWLQDRERLRLIENQFEELFRGIGKQNWSEFVDEIIHQTGCDTTQRVGDRIYDYFLQMYGALYLMRQGWKVRFQPMKKGGPDIEASRGTESCFMECTFKHTSKKLESLFWRFDSACGRNLAKKPILFSAQFRFPNAEKVEEIPPELFTATKYFISKVYQEPQEAHIGTFGDLKFEFNRDLYPTTTTDSQHVNVHLPPAGRGEHKASIER